MAQSETRTLLGGLAANSPPGTPPPFFRHFSIETLGWEHPGLKDFVELSLSEMVPHVEISAAIRERWGVEISPQTLSNYYRLRLWPRLCREGAVK